MTKRIKAVTISTREEFEQAANEAALIDTTILGLEVRRDQLIQRVRQRYAAKIDPLVEERDTLTTRAEKYAEGHRAELLPKDKKSVLLTLASFGWKLGNRAVKAISKKLDDQTIIANLKEAGLGSYVRTVEEIAKDKILADCKDDLTLAKLITDNFGDAVPVPVALLSVGLKITQADTFYIQPKEETGETLKATEAKAS